MSLGMSDYGSVKTHIFGPSNTYKDESNSASIVSLDEKLGRLPQSHRRISPCPILPVELASPDKHAPRDPPSHRNHPLNCETPL